MKNKKLLLVILIYLFFIPLMSWAADPAPGPFSYTPLEKIPGSDNVPMTDFYVYINAVYKFGIWAVGIAALLMIAIGGYMYITSAGNNTSMEKAKNVVTDSIVGLVLALTAYLLLYVINPDLVKISTLPTVTAPIAPAGPAVGPQAVPGVCNPATSGACSVSNMQNSCFASVASQASAICIKESSGNEIITNPIAKCSGEPVVIGLFQINISANPVAGLNCKEAFDHAYSNSNPNCLIMDLSLYNNCVAAAKNVTNNINAACAIYSGPKKWNSWQANTDTCHF